MLKWKGAWVFCQKRANNVGWYIFEEKYVNYRWQERVVGISRNPSQAGKGSVKEMHECEHQTHYGNIECFCQISKVLDMCYKPPEKYIAKAWQPFVTLKWYTAIGNAAKRLFPSLLRATITGA
jgi:hypothetical protein